MLAIYILALSRVAPTRNQILIVIYHHLPLKTHIGQPLIQDGVMNDCSILFSAQSGLPKQQQMQHTWKHTWNIRYLLLSLPLSI